MRNVINISLPEEMVRTVNREVRVGKFATKSEFFRHLVRLWNTRQLTAELEDRRVDFAAGKGKNLRSLRDLR